MRSSSTDRAPRRGFWPADAGAWARLAVVVVLGSGALVGPAIGATGAIYTDNETAGFDVIPSVAPTTPAPDQTTAPAAETTTAPSDPATQAVAPLTAQAPALAPDQAVADEPTTAPTTAAPTVTPSSAATSSGTGGTSPGSRRSPGPVTHRWGR